MKDLDLSVQDIKDLMGTMAKNRIGRLSLTQGNYRLEIEGGTEQVVVAAPAAMPAAAVPMAAPAPQEDAGEPELPGTVVRSPIVGTFYAAPAPDKAPFVSVGSRVKKGDVLFIIESMKLMNEVLCEQDGVVSKILAQNEQPVEYGQPILCLD